MVDIFNNIISIAVIPVFVSLRSLPSLQPSRCKINDLYVSMTRPLRFFSMQGFNSIMVDGSHLSFRDNVSFTKDLSSLAQAKNIMVEAELGRLSGTEDDLTVEDYEAKLTDASQVRKYLV